MKAQLDAMMMPLPSDFDDRIIQHSSLATAVQYERMIREGCANDALDKLRIHLTTHATLQDRRKQGSGVEHNTKMDRRLSAKKAAVQAAKDRYRHTRDILLVLGMPADDPRFKELHDSDAKAFVLVTEEQRLGDSSRKVSWIWSDFSFIMKEDNLEVKEFLVDSESRARRGILQADCVAARLPGALVPIPCAGGPVERTCGEDAGGHVQDQEDVPSVVGSVECACGRKEGRGQAGGSRIRSTVSPSDGNELLYVTREYSQANRYARLHASAEKHFPASIEKVGG